MRYRRVSTIPVVKVILPPDILIVVVVCNEAGIATRGASEFEIVIDDSPLVAAAYNVVARAVVSTNLLVVTVKSPSLFGFPEYVPVIKSKFTVTGLCVPPMWADQVPSSLKI